LGASAVGAPALGGEPLVGEAAVDAFALDDVRRHTGLALARNGILDLASGSRAFLDQGIGHAGRIVVVVVVVTLAVEVVLAGSVRLAVALDVSARRGNGLVGVAL
jgi:hypothetical protein